MANTLTNIVRQILVRGLVPLRESSTYVFAAAQDYSSDGAKPGTTIDIPKTLGAGTTSAVTPGVTPPTPSDTDFGNIQIQLSNWRKSQAFFLTDKEMREIEKNEHFLPLTVAEQVRGLSNYINSEIAGNYKSVYGAVGAAASAAFGSTSDIAVDARKLLKDQLSSGGWFGIISHAAEANFLKLADFKDADKTGENGVKIDGMMGDKFGVTWMTDHNVPTHTAGTPGGTPLVNNASAAVGDTTVPVDGMTGTTGDYHEGDIVTFAGDTQQYVVTADATANGSGAATLSIDPPLKVAVADNAAVTLVATHVANLVMQRGAFQYVQRPAVQPGDNMTGGRTNKIRATMRDQASGLMLSLERFDEYRQTAWELDVLFGTKGVRPEWAVRLLSSV